MNYEFLRYFLPIYFLLYFFVLVVVKGILIRKQIGKSPIVLQSDDSAYSLLGFYFKLTMLVLAFYILAFSVFPEYYDYFLPIRFLQLQNVKLVGVILLTVSFLWIVIAQNNMRKSWRIGIDLQTKTELITNGIFSFSRNPIFLGMLVSLVGLFLATPNTLTLIIAVAGYITTQVQIRLEEEYLTKMHGQTYLDYKQKVRRLL